MEEQVLGWEYIARKVFLGSSNGVKPRKGKNSKERFTCHEYGKAGHMRFQCPTYLEKVDSDTSTPRDFKSKKAYIVWDVPEEETTSSTSSEEEFAKLCLVARIYCLKCSEVDDLVN
ncbi:unnamed protein product [Lupinus luteus]|uniref:CCHC-type domain-containing protein n=1 Tax=Lupinus luteus TaxID=3873 RepID=A0AAV1YDL2_LUPLU